MQCVTSILELAISNLWPKKKTKVKVARLGTKAGLPAVGIGLTNECICQNFSSLLATRKMGLFAALPIHLEWKHAASPYFNKQKTLIKKKKKKKHPVETLPPNYCSLLLYKTWLKMHKMVQFTEAGTFNFQCILLQFFIRCETPGSFFFFYVPVKMD